MLLITGQPTTFNATAHLYQIKDVYAITNSSTLQQEIDGEMMVAIKKTSE